jgi:hypothetical protein
MAVADVSAGHQHPIATFLKSADDKQRVHSSGAHDPHGPQVGRILQPGDASQIRTRIGTPVTQKGDNLRLKVSHGSHLLFWVYVLLLVIGLKLFPVYPTDPTEHTAAIIC